MGNILFPPAALLSELHQENTVVAAASASAAPIAPAEAVSALDDSKAKSQFLGIVNNVLRESTTEPVFSESSYKHAKRIEEWFGAEVAEDLEKKEMKLIGIVFPYFCPLLSGTIGETCERNIRSLAKSSLVNFCLYRHGLRGYFDLRMFEDSKSLQRLVLIADSSTYGGRSRFGQLTVDVTHLSSLPDSVRQVRLEGNKIVGVLSTFRLPFSLRHLQLSAQGGGYRPETTNRDSSLAPQGSRLSNIPDLTTFSCPDLEVFICNGILVAADGAPSGEILLDLTHLPRKLACLDVLCHQKGKIVFVIDFASLPDRFLKLAGTKCSWWQYIQAYCDAHPDDGWKLS